jgi:ATP adenylyltransferase
MDNLWTPWRMKYVTNAEKPGSCIFCDALMEKDDLVNFVVHRAKNTYAILNRFPYTSGHLMIVPNLHVPSIEELTAEVRAEMMEMVNSAIVVLRRVYRPDGFNVGINMGIAAGAGIAEHAHIHIVPRWAGDTSFVSTVGETRVIPEELGETWKRVRENWK